MTPQEMIDKRLTIQDGYLKGARIKITEEIAKELMEKFAKEKQRTEEELKQYLLDWHRGETNFSIKELMEWLYGREV